MSDSGLSLRKKHRVTWASFALFSKHDRKIDTRHMSESKRFGLMFGRNIHSWGFISFLSSTYCGHVKGFTFHSGEERALMNMLQVLDAKRHTSSHLVMF